MPKAPSNAAQKLIGGHFDLVKPVASPDTATQLSTALKLRDHYKGLTPRQKDHFQTLQKFIAELEKIPSTPEASSHPTSAIASSNAHRSSVPQATLNTETSTNVSASTATGQVPGADSVSLAPPPLPRSGSSPLTSLGSSPSPGSPSNTYQGASAAPSLDPHPGNQTSDVHSHLKPTSTAAPFPNVPGIDYTGPQSGIPPAGVHSQLNSGILQPNPQQYTASSRLPAGFRYQGYNGHEPEHTTSYPANLQDEWVRQQAFSVDAKQAFSADPNRLYSMSGHQEGHEDHAYSFHFGGNLFGSDNYCDTAPNKAGTSLGRGDEHPYPAVNPLTTLDAYTTNQFITSYKSLIDHDSKHDLATCHVLVSAIISRLEQARQGSTGPYGDIGWPSFATNVPSLQELENVVQWLVNNGLGQPLQIEDHTKKRKPTTEFVKPTPEFSFFENGELIALSSNVKTSARTHPERYPGVVEEGKKLAREVLRNRVGVEKCISCTKRVRGKEKHKSTEELLECGCSGDLACLELWVTKITRRHIQALKPETVEDFATVIGDVSGHTTETIFYGRPRRRDHTAKWAVQALISHFSDEAKRLIAAGDHEEAAHETEVAEKYKKAFEQLTGIWEERQARQSNDRAGMEAEYREYSVGQGKGNKKSKKAVKKDE